MMERKIYDEYVQILKEELIPAMGCTEPIAIAYAAALARETLGCMPDEINVKASPNIIKNVKSVVVPNTGGKRGIQAAVAAGIVAGDADKELQVLVKVSETQIRLIDEYMDSTECVVEQSDKPYIFDIQVNLSDGGHRSFVEIAGNHTNVIRISFDDDILSAREYTEEIDVKHGDRSSLNVRDIIGFADEVNISDVKDVLRRQIDFNKAIAEEGLKNKWGANIGQIILKTQGTQVHNRAKAYAAAGSDARMNGCELPVVINSGSGNQGLTTSLPVIVFGEELNVSEEQLYRALVVSNLITIHLKTGIGPLSAYCGATSAGCGAAAGVSYLYGGRYYEIAHTVVNGLSINSGMICDGAKSSCAAKIASAVEAGLLGMQMQKNASQFYDGEGIVKKGIENTINNVSQVARDGMRETDKEIIRIMLKR